jgi:hypothetical protein
MSLLSWRLKQLQYPNCLSLSSPEDGNGSSIRNVSLLLKKEADPVPEMSLLSWRLKQIQYPNSLSLSSPEDGNGSSIRNVSLLLKTEADPVSVTLVISSYLELRTMDKVSQII